MDTKRQQLAQWILEDPAILEQFQRAKVQSDYEKITENILSKYEMLKFLGK